MRAEIYKKHTWYALCWALGLFVVFKLVLYANYISGFRMIQQDALVRHQIEQIDTEASVQTVFVGDSSLGNAINAPLYSEITGTSSLSLALTGSFGVQGSINMALRAMDQHPEIRNVVIMQTLDVFQRRFGSWPYATVDLQLPQTFKSIEISEGMSAVDVVMGYVQFVTGFHHFEYGKPDMTAGLSNDTLYTEQSKRRFNNGMRTLGRENWITGTPRESVVKALDMFARYCKERGIRCVFVFGPMHEEVVARSQPYLNDTFALLRKTKFITFV
ncbi:hypothetical protein [Oleidesulfovibrio sp.]|uniref:hypothetical protein n=1 Tax=Oleidesulfovibrio sp. TaxID=2909707 RepID=UPI003A8932C7